MGRPIAGLIVLLAISSLSNAAAQTPEVPRQYRGYFETVRGHGMTPLIPASSDFRPGYIYRLMEGQNGVFVRTVCEDAFAANEGRPRQPPRLIETRLPNTHRFTDNGFNASLSLAPGGVAQGVSGALSGRIGAVRTVDVTFDRVQEFEVAGRRRLEHGHILDREVNTLCLANLSDLQGGRRNFRERVFLVVRSTAPQAFRYTLAGEGGAAIDLSANIDEVATGAAGWRMRRVNNQSFEVARDVGDPQAPVIYIAAQIVRLSGVEDLNTVSTTRVRRIRPQPATLDDLIQTATAPRGEPQVAQSAPAADPASTPADQQPHGPPPEH